MKRVKKYGYYHYITLDRSGCTIKKTIELNTAFDDEQFNAGNYFVKIEDAESKRQEILSVLRNGPKKELPDENEMANNEFAKNPYLIGTHGAEVVGAFQSGWYECYKWLKTEMS